MQATKVRAVVQFLGAFTTSEVDMNQKIRTLEIAVSAQRHLTSLGGTLSYESLSCAIDMIRAKAKFPIRPHSGKGQHSSTLIGELSSSPNESRLCLDYVHKYKHFEGFSYSTYKAPYCSTTTCLCSCYVALATIKLNPGMLLNK